MNKGRENKKLVKFPKDFIWGVSTSAYQVEGGITNDWSEWETSEGRISELKERKVDYRDFICGDSCNSYNLYKEDIDLVKKMGCSAYRLGVEWARLEKIEGEFDEKEFAHYKKVLQYAKKQKIKVVLTIWHWTNPLWIAHQGGWASRKTVKNFSRFTKKVVKELGQYVDYWVVLNEPMIHVVNGNLAGKFPPNKRNLFTAIKVFNNLVSSYKESANIIHRERKGSKVSITQIGNYFEPARKWCLAEQLLAKIAKYWWNDRFLKKIHKQIDYIGLDYYFHDRIVWYPPFKKNINKKTTDMGWEVYPKGIYSVLKQMDKFKKPIIIMENGLSDANDRQRAEFIRNHLKYVHRAIFEGVNVVGYFHWSLLDNFEWAHGWEQKFGFFKVDKKTFRRTARPSAKVYADICKNNSFKI